MKVDTIIKVIVGIVVILTAGLIGCQLLKTQSPDIKKAQSVVKEVKPEDRRITMSPFVEQTSETGTETQQGEANIEFTEIRKTPVPETVPTTQSSDDEIRGFQAWLTSALAQEDPIKKIEQKNFSAEDDEIDSDTEKSMIKFVIEDQWKNSLEAQDIEGYMSAIWEDSFFSTNDMGTPNNADDDTIFRSGQQEREGTLKMFNTFDNIELSLYRNGDTEFLSETLALVDYNYQFKLTFTHPGASYPSGRIVFVLELRENEEWRILEWYDYPNVNSQ